MLTRRTLEIILVRCVRDMSTKCSIVPCHSHNQHTAKQKYCGHKLSFSQFASPMEVVRKEGQRFDDEDVPEDKKRTETEAPGTGKLNRISVDLHKTVEADLRDKKYKPKEHPGVCKIKGKVELPSKFVHAVEVIFKDANIVAAKEGGIQLDNYLWNRKTPVENYEFREHVQAAESKINMKDSILEPFLSADEKLQLERQRKNLIERRLKRTVYHWMSSDYDEQGSKEYLAGRSAGDFAALTKLFRELAFRDKQFQPTSLCDFGSGVGTVTWAANIQWPTTIKETLCVDTSRDMNDLAEKIMKGGRTTGQLCFPNVFFRQFLPESAKVSYDLMVSAYSLLELPSAAARVETLDILWKKTAKYLVLVERGTNAGFKAIIEARDYILGLHKQNRAQAHVFSPCPHELQCPRFTQDYTPCNFSVLYRPLLPFDKSYEKLELFCYVIIKRGENKMQDRWPRVVRHRLLRSRQVICRVCTSKGKLSEVILTKKNSSEELYRCGRKTNWGDLLPVHEITKASDDDDKDDVITTEALSKDTSTDDELSD